MTTRQEHANQFELWGPGIYISFSASSIDGSPRLAYCAYGKEKSFGGDEIRVSETELGRMVSVTLEAVPDLKVDSFSFLLPRINMAVDEDVRFRTIGINATHYTSIGGPHLVKGALASYDGTDLVGMARSVVF